MYFCTSNSKVQISVVVYVLFFLFYDFHCQIKTAINSLKPQFNWSLWKSQAKLCHNCFCNESMKNGRNAKCAAILSLWNSNCTFSWEYKTFYKWLYRNGHQLLTKMASIKLDSWSDSPIKFSWVFLIRVWYFQNIIIGILPPRAMGLQLPNAYRTTCYTIPMQTSWNNS